MLTRPAALFSGFLPPHLHGCKQAFDYSFATRILRKGLEPYEFTTEEDG